MEYYKEFIIAIERSKKYKIDLPNIYVDKQKRYLDSENFSVLPKLIESKFPNLELKDYIRRCLDIGFFMRKEIQKLLVTDAYLTFGYVKIGNEERGVDIHYEFGEQDIQNWLSKKKDILQVPIHAWITLPSMEIIDFTFGCTLSEVYDNEDFLGRFLSTHPENLKDMSYHPMLIGDDFLFQAGLLKFT